MKLDAPRETDLVWRYRYSNLVIDADLPFPELAPDDGAGGDLIRLRAGDPANNPASNSSTPQRKWTLPDGTIWTTFTRGDGYWEIDFPSYCTYRLHDGGMAITYAAKAETAMETIRHLILNQVLPLAMSALGRHSFHASAVKIGTRAAVFAGASGSGKSTLALSFAAAGMEFLSDDLVAVERTGDRMEVIPSYPALRVCQDTLQQAGIGGMRIAPSAEYGTKSRILAGEGIGYSDRHVELGAIYLLEPGPADIRIEAVKGAASILELVRTSFILDASCTGTRQSHFAWVAEISSMTPLFRLRYPRDFGQLEPVRRAVIKHLGSLQ
jgi:hypothetical protein